MPFDEHQVVFRLSDSQLEDLVKKWLARLKDEYKDFERPTESADMGRDAVGFLSDQRYDGEWHNYQCKHLKEPLGLADFTTELGKIFYYSSVGSFTLPTKYIFVAPNAAVRSVKTLINRPSLMKDFLLSNWDNYCLTGISKAPCPLTADIATAISTYNFANVELWKASELARIMHQRPEVPALAL